MSEFDIIIGDALFEREPPDKGNGSTEENFQFYTSCECRHTVNDNFSCIGCGICYHTSLTHFNSSRPGYESLRPDFYEDDTMCIVTEFVNTRWICPDCYTSFNNTSF